MNPVLINKFVSYYERAHELARKEAFKHPSNDMYSLELVGIDEDGFRYDVGEGIYSSTFYVFWNDLI